MSNRRLDALLEAIRQEVKGTAGYTGRSELKPEVYTALRNVDRARFVRPDDRDLAWYNGPLQIGEGQTISQPYIVALMTDMLEIGPDSRVLEIGTGSGYQTAVLAELAREVYTVERIAPLSEMAQTRLQEMGYENIRFRIGDGHEGWPEHAPYDAIIVTAAADDIPPALIEQLKPGGHLVIPVSVDWLSQQLLDVTRNEAGETEMRKVLPVSFVPLR
jgi:protein-L-isoaspartate(D-aspartate) O-methyltransferase